MPVPSLKFPAAPLAAVLLLAACPASTSPRPTPTAETAEETPPPEPPAVCGNAIVEPGEVCDDGYGATCPDGWALCMHCVRCEGRVLRQDPLELGPWPPPPLPSCRWTDARGDVAEQAYDDRGRLIEARHIPFNGTVDRVTTYTWDDRGRPLGHQIDHGADGTIDDRFQVTYPEPGVSHTEVHVGGELLYRTVETFTPDGRPLRAVSTDPDDTVTDDTTLTYDEAGRRIRSASDFDGDGKPDSVEEYERDAEGHIVVIRSRERRDGELVVLSEQTRTVDALGRPIRLVDTAGPNPDSVTTITYGPRGAEVERVTVHHDNRWTTRSRHEGTRLVEVHRSDARGNASRTTQRWTDTGWTLAFDSGADGTIDSRQSWDTGCLAPLRETAPNAIPAKKTP